MARRVTGGQVLQNMNTGTGFNYKENMVNLKPDPQTGVTKKELRLVGLPIEFREAQPRKRAADDKTKTVQCDFPDATSNKSFTRICHDDPSQDIWTQLGYITTRRYAINCIDRKTGKVMILSKGSSIFGEFYKSEKANKDENIELAEQGEPLMWTQIGGEEAPNTKIIATYNENALGKVVYEVRYTPRVNKLTSEEIEMLRTIGCPTPEQLKQIRDENPDLADAPDWFFYGFDLEKVFKPSVLRTGTEAPAEVISTPVAEMTLNIDDDEDEDDTPVIPAEISAPAVPAVPNELEEGDWDF